ncbi:hypothetical protein HYQ44_009603 [Verticillium longisporum]|nr:hypothetical protein HYQ44_009603 [Verticillium longisporum]
MLETGMSLSNTDHSCPHILLFIDTSSTRAPTATGEDLYNLAKQLACELLRIACSHYRNPKSDRPSSSSNITKSGDDTKAHAE